MNKYPSRIIGVQFGTASLNDIAGTSVCEVRSKEMYAQTCPTTDGLMSPAMGPASDLINGNSMVCPTDGLGEDKSPGYFGHIVLQKPIIWLQHASEIRRVLETVCIDCGECRLDISRHPHILELPLEKRPNAVKKAMKKKDKKCRVPSCMSVFPSSVKRLNMANIAVEYKRQGETSVVVLSPQQLLVIFQRISDRTCSFIGCDPIFARPENLVCQALPVPPPQMRPSTRAGDSQRKAEDDITLLLQRVVQENNELELKLKETMENMDTVTAGRRAAGNGATAKDPATADALRAISAKATTIQYLVAVIVENRFQGGETPMQHQSGKAFTSLKDRLDRKGGRLRKNCLAKRVDVSARSVITGDPNLGVRRFGLPSRIANKLTIPMRVNRINKAYLERLLANRFAEPEAFPNIQSIKKLRADGSHDRNRTVRMDTQLKMGDIVYRTMRSGDRVLLNRAPSLHKNSIQAHEAMVLHASQGSTIGIPPCVTTGYNADFDGDEMNLHVPQSKMAEAELYGQAAVENNIVNPATNAPITGLVQDTMLGASLFTRSGQELDPLAAMRMLCKTDRSKYSKFFDTCVKNRDAPNAAVDPKGVLTCILPRFSMRTDTGYLSRAKRDKRGAAELESLTVEVRDGEYRRGRLDKGAVMEATNGMLHRIITEHGNQTGAQFLDDMESVITEFMKGHSASVGIADMLQNHATRARIGKIVEDGLREANALIEQVHLGTFQNDTAFSNRQWFELRTMRILEDITKRTEEVGYEFSRDSDTPNGMNEMVYCGSKGKVVQLREMSMLLGQQKVDGGRVQDDLNGRTLPHYTKYNLCPEARGFIGNSFMTGLTPLESNPQLKVARTGLTNTSVKTQETGYMQRRFVKFMENLMAAYDNTVRNGQRIVQYRFGDDGANPEKHLNVDILEFLTTSVADMFKRFNFYDEVYRNGDLKEQYESERQLAMEKCARVAVYLLDAQAFLVKSVFTDIIPSTVQCTVNFPQLVESFRVKFKLDNQIQSDITPFAAMERIVAAYEYGLNSLGTYNRPCDMFRMLYFYYLTPKILIQQLNFSSAQLDLLLEDVVRRYVGGIIHPGTNVGVISGQTLGSSATQTTLNVFHLAGGQAAKNTRMLEGIPRTGEIILASTTKTPAVYVKLLAVDGEVLAKRFPVVTRTTEADDMEVRMKLNAMQVAREVERVVLRDLVDEVNVVHSPAGAASVDEDGELLRRFRKHEALERRLMGAEEAPGDQPWVFRLRLNAVRMAERGVTMQDIDFCLRSRKHVSGQDDMRTVFSDMSDRNLIFRVPIPVALRDTVSAKTLSDMQARILETPIRGVDGMTDVTVVPDVGSLVWNPEKKQFEAQKNIPYLDATGNNLRGVLAVDGVDTYRTWCNDIRTMKEVFGMESCRYMILAELSKTLSDANYAHISLLVDKMTYGTDIAPVWRTGIRDDNVGPFMKASFETTTEMFNEAARRGSLDDMCGVSANVICGQQGKFGTNAFKVLVHPDFFETLAPAPVAHTKQSRARAREVCAEPGALIDYAPPAKKKNLSVPYTLPLLF